MFTSSYIYQEYELTTTYFKIPSSEIFSVESEPIAEKAPTNDIHWEDVSINNAQENGFFKGLLYALPVSLLSWALIIWVVRELWRNF